MITKERKAQALARIKALDSLELIAEEMALPLTLLKEWEANMSDDDLVTVKANTNAVARVLAGEIVEGSEQLLKQRLEEAAVEVAIQAHRVAGSGDIIAAKTVDLCASAITKLYASLIQKAGSDNPIFTPSATGRSLFQSQMRD